MSYLFTQLNKVSLFTLFLAALPAGAQGYPPLAKGADTNGQASVMSTSLPSGSAGVPTIEGAAVATEKKNALDGAELGSQLYLGAGIGGSNFRFGPSIPSSGTAFTVQFGLNASEYVGFEAGYSHQSVGLYVGLEQRSGGQIVTPGSATGALVGNSRPTRDTSMSANILSLETQFHLTPVREKFRPFVGGGFAYKTTALSEDLPGGTLGANGGTLEQSAFGATAVLGIKARITSSFQLVFTGRYLFPLSTSEPTYNVKSTPNIAPNGRLIGAPNLYNATDTRFTSAGLGQLLFSGVYLF